MRLKYDTSDKDNRRLAWYEACEKAAVKLREEIPEYYRSRTFSGIIGDIKALSPKKALSLVSRKKGLGLQYAYLYLKEGIDNGYGYQACASEALAAHLGSGSLISGNILDAGCAVGVTGGILALPSLHGFDLFPDILKAAYLTDSFTGAKNTYTAADMTKPWPYRPGFDTVTAGLVCHHLKDQESVRIFFGEANRVLRLDASLVVTLPSGSISSAQQLHDLLGALADFGFESDRKLSGMLFSTDSEHSVFWMFILAAQKRNEPSCDIFLHDSFGFQELKTPVSRELKAVKARRTAETKRRIRHNQFEFVSIDEMMKTVGNSVLTFETIRRLI